MQQELFSSLDHEFFSYQSGFIAADEASRLLTELWNQLAWQQYEITIYGRRVAQPRLSAWYGATEARYRYSGLQLEPLPWHPLLFELKTKLEEQLQQSFNSVLANAYRCGRDSMGWHADDEPELGPRPLVASISLGAERRFLVRKKGDTRTATFRLENGSLLVMKRGCQEVHQHSVPKTRKEIGLRVNLTFRQIENQPPP
jgi:alkylated DNA repair dioxygenase AlkB